MDQTKDIVEEGVGELDREIAILVYQDLCKELKRRIFGVYSWEEIFRDVSEMTLISESYLHLCVLQNNRSLPYNNHIACLKAVSYVLKNMFEYREKVLTGEVSRNGKRLNGSKSE